MKLLRKLFSRIVLVSLGIAVQLAWLFFILFYLSAYYLPIALGCSLVSLAAVIYIINRPGNPQVKMAWIVPILVFPLFGGCGFFGYYGHFFDLKNFERVRVYASEWRNMVELTTIYEERIWLSSGEAEALVSLLSEEIEATS